MKSFSKINRAMKATLTLPLFLATSAVMAEDYVSFSDAEFVDFTESDAEFFTLGSRYYFDNKTTKGPLKEFDYLNTVSTVYGFVGQVNQPGPNSDVYGLGGDWFIGRFLVGAEHIDNDAFDSSQVRLGYLFAPNFLAKITLLDSDAAADFLLTATYDHDLGNNKYIGFTAEVDDEMDNLTLSSKYFTPLTNGEYLTVTGTIYSSDLVDDSWELSSEYFFNKFSSVGATIGDEEISIMGSHFFNNNISLRAEYTDYDNDLLGESISVSGVYQF
ncbi:putative porin [Pleionea litopenaei]|uniref:Porin n=1 Tax=Pleionea litopenaei TaxID=3070815 RepID=A0AA51X6T6_9GAMM|nr:putative porin [Pleionea sp. HL-JVS1]WMS87176.1 putative porin [Pleionea sp. HL-JVS1]